MRERTSSISRPSSVASSLELRMEARERRAAMGRGRAPKMEPRVRGWEGDACGRGGVDGGERESDVSGSGVAEIDGDVADRACVEPFCAAVSAAGGLGGV